MFSFSRSLLIRPRPPQRINLPRIFYFHNSSNTKESNKLITNPSTTTTTSEKKRKRIPFIFQHEESPPPPPRSDLPTKRQTSNICLLLDLDNVLIGEIFPNFGRDNRKLQLTIIDTILEACKARGRVTVKWAYGDALRYKELRPDFHQRAVDMIDTPPHQRGGVRNGTNLPPPKNSADIKMVVDAMELAYTNDNIDTYVLASGDSDFTPVLSKLRELGKHTIVISLPERLSWRLEEYSDETLSLTELFRNRKIENKEYDRALRAIYAAYEFQDLFANSMSKSSSTTTPSTTPSNKKDKNNNNANKHNPNHPSYTKQNSNNDNGSHFDYLVDRKGGGSNYMNLNMIRSALGFLQNDATDTEYAWDQKLLVRNTTNNNANIEGGTDLDWVLNTKDAAKHIQVKRGYKGIQYIRPKHFDKYHGQPGPSQTRGSLTRNDRLKILEMRLRQNNVYADCLRHDSTPTMLEQFSKSWEWKETEGYKGVKRHSKSAKIRLRGSLIQKLTQFASIDLKDRDLQALSNKHVRQIIDLGIASGCLILQDQDTSISKEEDRLAVYKAGKGIDNYSAIREHIDVYVMQQVLFHTGTCTIVPDVSEWYALLYQDLPKNSTMWKNGEIGENIHRDNVISSMNSHDIHYLERVEKRARDEFLNQPIKVENTFDQDNEEEKGFLAKMFGF